MDQSPFRRKKDAVGFHDSKQKRGYSQEKGENSHQPEGRSVGILLPLSLWHGRDQYIKYQQVAPSYPEMAETVANGGMPFGAGAWRYITEHQIQIGKVVQPIAISCKSYVDLLAGLIGHFEPFVPDGGQS